MLASARRVKERSVVSRRSMVGLMVVGERRSYIYGSDTGYRPDYLTVPLGVNHIGVMRSRRRERR